MIAPCRRCVTSPPVSPQVVGAVSRDVDVVVGRGRRRRGGRLGAHERHVAPSRLVAALFVAQLWEPAARAGSERRRRRPVRPGAGGAPHEAAREAVARQAAGSGDRGELEGGEGRGKGGEGEGRGGRGGEAHEAAREAVARQAAGSGDRGEWEGGEGRGKGGEGEGRGGRGGEGRRMRLHVKQSPDRLLAAATAVSGREGMGEGSMEMGMGRQEGIYVGGERVGGAGSDCRLIWRFKTEISH